MELAGLAVAEAVYSVCHDDTAEKEKKKKRVLLVCGPGNNGGDGLVAARHLVHFGLEADVVYPKPSSKGHFVNLIQQCRDVGVPILNEVPTRDGSNNKYDVVVDAVFGFSFDSASTIREPFATAIRDMIRLRNECDATVISVDVPSGWDVDGGDLTGMNFNPDVLVSLTAPKLSSKKFRGRHFVGGRFLPPDIAEKYGVKVRELEEHTDMYYVVWCRVLVFVGSTRTCAFLTGDKHSYRDSWSFFPRCLLILESLKSWNYYTDVYILCLLYFFCNSSL